MHRLQRLAASLLTFRARSVAASAALIAGASLLSRLLGVLRDRLLSGSFGAGRELDAYYAAFRFPDFFFNLFVLGAVGAAFIPVMSSYLAADRDREGTDAPSWQFVQRLTTVLGVIIAVAAVVCGLAAPLLVPLLTPGFGADDLALTVRLTRVMFLAAPLLALSSVMGSVLQSHRRFLAFAFAPVAYNLGIIGGIAFLSPTLGIVGAAWGVVAGIVLHFMLQWFAARAAGFRWRWRWQPRDAGVLEMARLAVPRTLALATGQVNLMILTGQATLLGAGTLAVFSLAFNLGSFPVGLIGISFAVASFPVVADLAARGRTAELVAEFTRIARTVLFLALPATVLFLLLRAQVVRVVLGTGRFDWGDTVMTADALAFLVISVFAQSLLPLVTRTFFALRDVKTPLLVGLVSIAAERLLAYWLTSSGVLAGASGLALAYSIGGVVNLVLLWVFLRRRLGGLGEGKLIRPLTVMTVSALAAAVVVQVAKTAVGGVVDMRSFVGVFAQGAVAGTAGFVAYLAVSMAFGLSEARQMFAFGRRGFDVFGRRLRRRGPVISCGTTMAGLDGSDAPHCEVEPPTRQP